MDFLFATKGDKCKLWVSSHGPCYRIVRVIGACEKEA